MKRPTSLFLSLAISLSMIGVSSLYLVFSPVFFLSALMYIGLFGLVAFMLGVIAVVELVPFRELFN